MSASPCPVVGVGASAGGLEAFQGLLRSIPLDSGAAYVLVQHLDPTHKSLTAEILQRSTSLPVFEVQNGCPVEGNNVYVIPPNRCLTLENGRLRLSAPVLRRGIRMPVDEFLWSLAQEPADHAAAIILSGTGSDGTIGVRAIKGSGGLTLAQIPTTAQFDGMPSSAIATGMVDIVCPSRRWRGISYATSNTRCSKRRPRSTRCRRHSRRRSPTVS